VRFEDSRWISKPGVKKAEYSLDRKELPE
jgi:hypothetical protein